MDSKMKHRILGVLVIVGLGVLIYPLLQSNKDMPNEQVLVKAPPFPDQASPLNAGPTPTVEDETKTPEAATPVPTETTTVAPDSTASSEDVTPDDTLRQQPDDTIAPTTPNVVNVKAPTISSEPETAAPAAQTPETSETAAPQSEAEKPTVKPLPADTSDNENITSSRPEMKIMKASLSSKSHHRIAAKTAAKAITAAKPKTIASAAVKAFKMPKQDDSNGLLKLNQTAWVIQVGSFKQKTEAMRFVNQLRGNGYRAFIQQLPSENGNSTQVFVGPENRQHLARALAAQLQSDMQVKGVVVSYQPFAL